MENKDPRVNEWTGREDRPIDPEEDRRTDGRTDKKVRQAEHTVDNNANGTGERRSAMNCCIHELVENKKDVKKRRGCWSVGVKQARKEEQTHLRRTTLLIWSRRPGLTWPDFGLAKERNEQKKRPDLVVDGRNG